MTTTLQAPAFYLTAVVANRSGDLQANCALFTVVLNGLTCDDRIRAYMSRRARKARPNEWSSTAFNGT